MALRVEDINLVMRRLKEMNIPLRDQEPRDGDDGSKIAFIEPISTPNILTELVERDKEVKKD